MVDHDWSSDSKKDAYTVTAPTDEKSGSFAFDGEKAGAFDTDDKEVGEALDDITRDAEVQQKLSQRHLQLVSLAGAVGTGLWLSTGTNLAQGGPLGLMLSFIIVGSFVVGVMMALSEMACLAPTSGSFIRFAGMFCDRAVGFSAGFTLVWGCSLSICSEVSACAVLVQYWTDKAMGAFITAFLIPIVLVNFFSVRWLGEAESAFAILKILLVVIVVITGIVVDVGGGPNGQYLGARYWHHPGPLVEYMVGGAKGRFFGVWSALISAAYSFAGTESVAMLAAETKSPRQNIAKAAKRVFFRVLLLYIVSVFMLTLLVPSNDPALAGDTSTARGSPFVIAFQRAGIRGLGHFINAVLITSALSSGEQACLSGSRALVGMALDRLAPKIFTKTHRGGVPYLAVGVVLLLSPLAYTSVSGTASNVFYWFTVISSTGTLWSWCTICFTYLRVYYGMKKQGIPRSELPFRSWGQPYLTWYAFFGCFFILITSGFTCFVSPISENFTASAFLSSYLSIFINVATLIGFKLLFRTHFKRLDEIPIRPWLQHVQANPEEPLPKTRGWRLLVGFLWA